MILNLPQEIRHRREIEYCETRMSQVKWTRQNQERRAIHSNHSWIQVRFPCDLLRSCDETLTTVWLLMSQVHVQLFALHMRSTVAHSKVKFTWKLNVYHCVTSPFPVCIPVRFAIASVSIAMRRITIACTCVRFVYYISPSSELSTESNYY